MACYHPMRVWPAKELNVSGKRGIVFKRSDALGVELDFQVPCGQCVGCRLEKSRQWAIRCMHEAELHDANCFLTLTYDDKHMPEDGSVDVKVFQLFMKKLRKRYGKMRFFHCGEYGDNLGRPHYHALLFGFDFPDKVFYKKAGEHSLYSSESLNSIWGLGYCLIGAVSFDSAAYVARYVLKKRTGRDVGEHYTRTDPDTGEVLGELSPEYITMSRGGTGGGGGIGSGWFKKFKEDIYGHKHDMVVSNGHAMRPPKFYDTLLERVDPDLFRLIKARRLNVPESVIEDRTPRRLEDREIFIEERNKEQQLRRFENG